MRSTNTEKLKQSEQLAAEIAAFIEAGGQIKTCQSGMQSGPMPPPISQGRVDSQKGKKVFV